MKRANLFLKTVPGRRPFQKLLYSTILVSANVCSGIEIQSTHRQGLHELILGAEGVALNAALQEHVRRIEEHNTTLRDLAEAVPASARGPYEIDAFCNLEKDDDITAKSADAERRLAAARSADVIRRSPVFQDFRLPNFDIDAIDQVLGYALNGLEAEAAERVRAHIAVLGRGGEAWVSEGMPLIRNVSEVEGGDFCPFCAQELAGSDLIEHYRVYFSEAYQKLKANIRQAQVAVRDAHAGDIPSAFERDIRTAVQVHEFWKDFADLPQIEIDTAALARDWNLAREAVLGQLRDKAAAPLELMALTPDTREAIFNYRARIAEVATLSQSLIISNAKLEIVKEQAQADDLAALTDDLAKLTALQARFDPAVPRIVTPIW